MFFLVFIALVFIFPLLLAYILYRLVRFRRRWRVGETYYSMGWVKTEHYGNGDKKR